MVKAGWRNAQCFNYNLPFQGTGIGTVSAVWQMVARGSLSLSLPSSL